MASTLHLGIRGAVASALSASPALAGGRIHQNRSYVLNPGEASAIWVRRLDSSPARVVLGHLEWSTEVEVAIRTRASGSTSAESAADTLSADVFTRLMADPTLGGLAQDIQPGAMVWEDEEGDTPIAVCTLRATVLHRTTDLSIAA